MKHIDEHSLEIYVLNHESLDAATRQAIEQHLSACAGCRQLAKTIKTFYDSVLRDLETPDATQADVDIILQHIFPASRVIRLLPFNAEPDAAPTGDPYISVLAAMTPPPAPDMRFETVAIMASQQDHAVVRIQRDRETDTYKLYFLPQGSEHREGGVVTLPEPGIHLVLDEHRQAEFHLEPGQVPSNWDTVEALVRFPLTTIAVSGGRTGGTIKGTDPTGVYNVRLTPESAAYRLDIFHPDTVPSVRLAVVKGTSSGATPVTLTRGAGKLPIRSLPDEFVVCLYD